MKNKCSLIFIITGTALILSALFLCMHNIIEDKKSGEKSQNILNELKSQITVIDSTDKNPIYDTPDFYKQFEKNQSANSYKKIDGVKYLGYITLPTINIELPVMSDWDYNKLNASPCRYSGFADQKDLIIAAHNYNSHFRKIDDLNSGDIFYFTDADGKSYEYEVINTEIISGNDPDAMISDYDDSWDITLFTCTFDGRNRITVRGKLTEK